MKKRNKSKLFLGVFLAVFFILYSIKTTVAQEIDPDFNPNFIISDFEVLAYDSMDLKYIQDFLTAKGGFLATYSCANPEGKIMTASEIIYDRAITNKVSPKFIIALLQKEQGLIEDKNPKQSQLDWATGYGCPDGDKCNPRWQGFWKQVNSGSLQFRDYMDNPRLYTYKAGQTYIFTNPYAANGLKVNTSVTPVNQATAALYNYTPHVYNGNYNFYKLWKKYFNRPVYPDGSLLQAEGENGVWLIQEGKKRAFASKGALTSRFDAKKIIIVNKADLDKYETGKIIKFPQYSLVRSPRGTVFLLVDDKRRGFVSKTVFRKLGFQNDEVVNVGWDDINAYIEDKPLTATSTYPTGALVQDKKGKIYWVIGGTKAPIEDPILLKTKFKNIKVVKAKAKELDKYEMLSPVLFGDGELLKTSISSYIYLISNGKKHLIASDQVFKELGYKTENIITVLPQTLYRYEEGEPIKLSGTTIK